jgi:alpha-mannosidase
MMPQPPHLRDSYLSLRRFQTYLRDVIDPAVWTASHPLSAEVLQVEDAHGEPITAETALSRPFRPVSTGWAWGPRWSTAWFRISGSIPAAWAGLPVSLRFSSGTEGQIWSIRTADRDTGHATPLQGLDVNRDAYHLTPSARGGAPISALIEAACNHPFGAGSFEWDSAEAQHRWNSDTPGRLERCELAVPSAECWDLRQHYAFALNLLEDLPLDSNRAQDLIAALRASTNAVDQLNVPATAAKALAPLRDALARPAAGSTTRCLAVGHAHLDTAWLWPIRETKRKALRTFSNQLRNMELFPDYIFLASQAQHYAWVEERAPGLFEQIKARVAEGRWEPGGGMWIEPDVNCVSGESLARQILHGERYWREKFGDKGRQRFLYLPDTFGFGSNLPQIMRLAGLDTFITNKLHWWQHTSFPFTTFIWRGIDGSWVLGHNTPGQDYNATNTPKELRNGESTHRNKDIRPQPLASARSEPTPPTPTRDADRPLWLQPFGFGDGGGGATDWSIRFAQLAAHCDGVPRVEFSTASAFCEALHDQHARGADFPEWFGELDMEIHRGTLTSQAWIKEANRDAEEALRLAEILLVLSEPAAPARASSRQALDQAWKLTLLNQFHDILPGSSIGRVYDDAKKDHAQVQALATPIIEAGLSGDGRDPTPSVFNPTSAPFRGVAGAEARWVDTAPSLGFGVLSDALPAGVAPVTLERATRPNSGRSVVIDNGLLSAEITEDGSIVSLRSREGRELARPAGPLTTWCVYEDRPIMWDAWDVDHFYSDKGEALAGSGLLVLEHTPLRLTLRCYLSTTRGERDSQVEFVLDAGSPVLLMRATVDWRTPHRLLRLAVRPRLGETAVCTHGTHFGLQTRPLHRNTAHERARFEFPAHGWVDVSEQTSGLALFAPTKFGFSAAAGKHGVDLGVSLLRAPTWPDPAADLGRHSITLALMPHAGDWRSAGVVRQSELLRRPPVELPHGSSTRKPPFTLSGAPVEIDALKPAEHGPDLILRLHECHGSHGDLSIDWNFPVRSVRPVDLLERDSEHALATAHHAGPRTTIPLRPFQIVTLRISR